MARFTLPVCVALLAAPRPTVAVPIGGCQGDVDLNGVVDVADLLAVIAAWGQGSGTSDVDGPNGGPDGMVDTYDLLAVLEHWGACP